MAWQLAPPESPRERAATRRALDELAAARRWGRLSRGPHPCVHFDVAAQGYCRRYAVVARVYLRGDGREVAYPFCRAHARRRGWGG